MTMPKDWERKSEKKSQKKDDESNQFKNLLQEVNKQEEIGKDAVAPRYEFGNSFTKKQLLEVAKLGGLAKFGGMYAVRPRTDAAELLPLLLKEIAKKKIIEKETEKQKIIEKETTTKLTSPTDSEFQYSLPKDFLDQCTKIGLASILSEIPRQNFPDQPKSDNLVETIKDIILQVSATQGKHEATKILSKTLIGYNELMDEKKLQVAILGALSAKNEEKLTTIIETAFQKNVGEGFWQKMDTQFYDILRESKHGFKINTAINIILVIIGSTLIGNAIAYSWIYTADAWSIFSGGIGMGALVTLFFYKSQNAITKAIANLSVVDMVFKSHYRAYESVTDYDYRADSGTAVRSIQNLESMIKILEKTTRGHVKLIQGLLLSNENNDAEKKDENNDAENNDAEKKDENNDAEKKDKVKTNLEKKDKVKTDARK